MLRTSSSTLCLKGSSTRARVCHTCGGAPSNIFCQADLAYLCTTCDAQIHAANKLSSRHKRVWVCESCQQAPAAFICKADAASLCVTCDSVIHSANPLARRHHRVPVMPLSGSLDKEDDDEAASWLLLDAPMKNNDNGYLFNGEGGVDEYLDLVEYNSCQETQLSDDHKCNNDLQFDDYGKSHSNENMQQQQSYGSGEADSVVPNRYGEVKKQYESHDFQDHKFQLDLGLDYETSNAGYPYPASLSHSVSMSSLDIGIVPESTTTEGEGSISNSRTSKGTIDLFSSHSVQMATQLTPIDREARVLRYREKKKTRKFEKTIRYASRKAYAETRPRIKGRFAKRTNVEDQVDQMFSTKLMTQAGYCIVPSF